MVSFFVVVFILGQQYKWGISRSTQAIPAAFVTVFLSSHEGPSKWG